MLGNKVVGILRESGSKWERRAPLTPSHCARLLHAGNVNGVDQIIIQPCSKRIYPDSQYEDIGCEISEDLSKCGLVLGVKQPKIEHILPDRAYAFFSHTHKAQPENMLLLDKVLSERVSLYDYELIVGDHGKRLLAFGKYAGIVGMVDFLRGLGERFLNLGYSTPFLSLGSAYMYSSLTAAKAAIIAIGEEIASSGLLSTLCPLVFVFIGTGNVSEGAQEIFRLLPHIFVDPLELPGLFDSAQQDRSLKGSRQKSQVYGCVVTAKDLVMPKDSLKDFNKEDYYSHPENYEPVFHKKIAPYASVIVNCMYWEPRFPRLLTNEQMKELTMSSNRLFGVADITCDIRGSIECLNKATTIERPFFRFNPLTASYHEDMSGEGIIFLAVDILPTEVAKEATKHFGDVLSEFLGSMASAKGPDELPSPIRRACITHKGGLTPLYSYIKRMREDANKCIHGVDKPYKTLVSLNGHLFDRFLINEALDIIEASAGSFHLVKCEVGQSVDAMSHADIEVSAKDKDQLDHIVDMLASIASSENENKNGSSEKTKDSFPSSLTQVKKIPYVTKSVLILGAGHVCQPCVEFLAFGGCNNGTNSIKVVVASLYLEDAQKVIEGIPNTMAIQLDINNEEALVKCISKVDTVISLLPASCHMPIAKACIKLRRNLVTASYVDKSMSEANVQAKEAGVTILCEMGLDPGIDHMMAMKMIDEMHSRGGQIQSFVSECGGLPSPAAANNPLGYKFSWSPMGALRAGQNPALYMCEGQTINVEGKDLFEAATSIRFPSFPAFALERIPNRNSLVYGDLYGITGEASTIFRATLRYEGFSEIMGSLAKLGLLKNENHHLLMEANETFPRPSFNLFVEDLFKRALRDEAPHNKLEFGKTPKQRDIANVLYKTGCSKNMVVADKVASCLRFLGLLDNSPIPESCKSPIDVTCLCMEDKLSYLPSEQDMVFLHHQVEVTYKDDRPRERHSATLLEFGKTKDGKSQTAMATTVGIPAAIGAQLLLEGKIKSTGVLRPLCPEIYVPALEMLAQSGIRLHEDVQYI
eukprot:TRINITY_DN9844_c0_g1_i1.p1 TRINITY_DN9844_c0_g1~~TRINITY_DN9844_c0_g1_i1.p1  ORF type:complete len:1040 (-),score=221.91 TRINITY_DN9844_c0_g1_i1:386-3505(-)